jgi:hypothetical protein
VGSAPAGQPLSPALHFFAGCDPGLPRKTLRALTLSLIAAGCIASAHAQGLRAEVGKPLQQAANC